MQILRFILTTQLLYLAIGSGEADAEEVVWEHKSSSDGVEVYRESEPKDGLFTFKGVKIIDISIFRLASILLSKEKSVRLRTAEILMEYKILEYESIYRRVTYTIADIPWPLKNRDFILENRLDVDLENRTLTIIVNSTTHPDGPLTIGVRGKVLLSTFKLEMLSQTKTKATLLVRSDPGGYIPKWLVNTMGTSIPRDIINSLELQARNKENPDLPEVFGLADQFKTLYPNVA